MIEFYFDGFQLVDADDENEGLMNIGLSPIDDAESYLDRWGSDDVVWIAGELFAVDIDGLHLREIKNSVFQREDWEDCNIQLGNDDREYLLRALHNLLTVTQSGSLGVG